MEIYQLVVRGRSQRAVGEEFGIDQSRVSRICDAVDQHLFPIHQTRIRLLKSRQTASLTHIYNESMQAWERSKETGVTVAAKTTTAGQFPGDTTTTTTKHPVGHPQYLAEARGALADIRQIWGMDTVEDADAAPRDEFRFSGMPREQAIQLYVAHQQKKLQRLLDAATGGARGDN